MGQMLGQMALPGVKSGPRSARPPRNPRAKKETTADKLKAGQLPMFLTPKEIQENFFPLPGDRLADESAQDLWKRKAQESREGSPGDARKRTTKETLADSIAKQGVQNPITLSIKTYPGYEKPFVFGGHHRVAIAGQVRPNQLIPVSMADDFYSSTTMKKSDQRTNNDFNIGSGERLNY